MKFIQFLKIALFSAVAVNAVPMARPEPFSATTLIDGRNVNSEISSPKSLAVNIYEQIYVSDPIAGVVKMFSFGEILTIGKGVFTSPQGLAIDKNYNVYVADFGSKTVKVIHPDRKVTTLPPTFNSIDDVAVDGNGNIYVASCTDNKIWKITAQGVKQDVAGSGQRGDVDGLSTKASFNCPSSISTDGYGNVYVGDRFNFKVKKINPNGQVLTLAGNGKMGTQDGKGTGASMDGVEGIVSDPNGNIYTVARASGKIRKISVDGTVMTLGKVEGKPTDITLSNGGQLLVSTDGNNRIQKISL